MTRTCPTACLLLLLAASGALGADGIPQTPLPATGIASISATGTVTCTYIVWKPVYEIKLKDVVRNGQVITEEHRIERQVPGQHVATMVPGSFEVQNAKGEPLAADVIRQRLAKPTPVLFVQKGKTLDDVYRPLFKDDTLVLILKPAQSPAAAGELEPAPYAEPTP